MIRRYDLVVVVGGLFISKGSGESVAQELRVQHLSVGSEDVGQVPPVTVLPVEFESDFRVPFL